MEQLHERPVARGLPWIVGLDLQPSGNGPLEFVRWLADQWQGAGRPRVLGVHALEGFYLSPILGTHKLSELLRLARVQLVADARSAGAESCFSDLRVRHGASAVDVLREMAEAEGSEALVLGRHAPRAGRRLVRLGRIARQALAAVDRPTIVVPPDLTADAVGGGPIVATTDLSERSVPAVRFASRLAGRLGRELVILHVVAAPGRYAARYVDATALEEIGLAQETTAAADLQAWVAEHGFARQACRVRSGSVVGEVLAVAARTDACLIVAGSRQLATWERILVSSVSSELSAIAPCPVAVVPVPVARGGLGSDDDRGSTAMAAT